MRSLCTCRGAHGITGIYQTMNSLVAEYQNYFTPNSRAAILCRHVSTAIPGCDCSLIDSIPEVFETLISAELSQCQSSGKANNHGVYSASLVHFSKHCCHFASLIEVPKLPVFRLYFCLICNGNCRSFSIPLRAIN